MLRKLHQECSIYKNLLYHIISHILPPQPHPHYAERSVNGLENISLKIHISSWILMLVNYFTLSIIPFPEETENESLIERNSQFEWNRRARNSVFAEYVVIKKIRSGWKTEKMNAANAFLNVIPSQKLRYGK